MARHRPSYRPRKRAKRMYRHYDRYGTAGMSRRQIQELARESDIGANPRGRRHTHADHEKLSRYSTRWGTVLNRGWAKEGRASTTPGRWKMLRKWGAATNRASRDAGTVYSRLIMQKTKWGKTVREAHGDVSAYRRWSKRRLSPKAARLLAGHRNPKRRGRNPDIFDNDPRDGYTVTSNGEHYRVSSKYVSYQDLGSGWYFVGRGIAERDVDAAIKRDQARRGRNPKRDGTPTRGEVRRTKYLTHLDSLIQRAEETKAKLKLIKKTPIGATTPHHYESHPALKTEIREEAMRETTGERAVPAVIASAAVESKVMSQAMHDLNEAHAYLLQKLRELGEEGPDDEIAEIQDQIGDIAKQKRKLRAEAAEPVASNPRRRNPYGRNPSRGHSHRHGRTWRLRGLPAYARALGRYCDAIHHYCTRPRRR